MPDFFEVDFAQTDWRPVSLQELAGELGRVFEQPVSPEAIEFFAIDDALGKRPLSSDDEVRSFSSSAGGEEQNGEEAENENKSEGSTASGVIRAALPAPLEGVLRQAKRPATLATGRQIAEYAGDVKNHGIKFSFKVFDCGHFRLKEASGAASGSGTPSSPSAASKGFMMEGRWEEVKEGVKLDFQLRYAWHSRRRHDDSVTYSLPPPEVQPMMLVFGEEEQLRGPLPSLLASEPVGDIALQREADAVAPVERSRPNKPRPAPPKPKRDWDDDWDSDEPTWPMYLGIFLFIFIICVFAWVWYEENYSVEAVRDSDEL